MVFAKVSRHDQLIELARAWRKETLSNLTKLNCRNTKAPVDLATLNTASAKAIFQVLLEGVILKLVQFAIVGMGKVGKSSLFHPLFLNKPLPKDEYPKSTHDLEFIRPEKIGWKPRILTTLDCQLSKLSTLCLGFWRTMGAAWSPRGIYSA